MRAIRRAKSRFLINDTLRPALKDATISESIKDVINAHAANRPVRKNYDPGAEIEALMEFKEDRPGLGM